MRTCNVCPLPITPQPLCVNPEGQSTELTSLQGGRGCRETVSCDPHTPSWSHSQATCRANHPATLSSPDPREVLGSRRSAKIPSSTRIACPT